MTATKHFILILVRRTQSRKLQYTTTGTNNKCSYGNKLCVPLKTSESHVFIVCLHTLNNIDYFQIKVVDNDLQEPATCMSVNDPHIATFDGR
jgi:hypothetical protein